MKKDAYYFPHFSNARNDAKLIKLRRVLGIEGYGLYFMLLEVLREQTEFKFPILGIEDLAYEWHISKEKIASVIKDFDLFEIHDNKFFSSKLIFYLQPYLEKSERARQAALIRWNNANAYANALPEQSKCDASKVKETKEEETKLNKSIKFYETQIEKNENEKFIKEYKMFYNILIGENKAGEQLTDLLLLQFQVSYKAFEGLISESRKRDKKFSSILLKINNDEKYYKGKKSLPIILYTWLETEYK